MIRSLAAIGLLVLGLVALASGCARSPATAAAADQAELACAPAACFASAMQKSSAEQGRDYFRARALFESACRRAHRPACIELVFQLHNAVGGPGDARRGRALLRQGCQQRHSTSCALEMLRSGTTAPTSENHPELLAGLEKECGQREPRACVALSWAAGREEARIDGARRACELGHLPGCLRQSRMLRAERLDQARRKCPGGQGADAEQSVVPCLEWMRANDPDFAAQLRKTTAEANRLEERACRGGVTEACFPLSVDPEDPARRALHQNECSAGRQHSCLELATAEKDATRVEQSCAQRFGPACEQLGDLLRDGRWGLEVDAGGARKSYQIACEEGAQEACVRLEQPELGGGCLALRPLSDNPALGRLPAAAPNPRVIDGKGIAAELLRVGRPTLLLVTASWEPDAAQVRDLPELRKTYEKLQLVVLLNDDPKRASTAAVPAAAAAGDIDVRFDPPVAEESLGPATAALGVEKVSELLLIDASGVIRQHLRGPFRDQAALVGAHARSCIGATLFPNPRSIVVNQVDAPGSGAHPPARSIRERSQAVDSSQKERTALLEHTF